MKKFCILSISILLITCLFCSFSNRTNIKAVIKKDYYIEIEKTNSLCNDIFSENNDFSYELIFNINDEVQYILAEGTNSYLIFDIILDDFIEYCEESNSLFFDLPLNVEKVYYPVGYFIYKYNNCYYTIRDNEVISNEDIITLREYFKDFEVKLIKNKENNAKGGAKSGELPIEAEVPYSYYFENLKENMGSNMIGYYPGSCSYVAMGMLLSYYDSVKDDSVISEYYDRGLPNNFNSYSSISCEAYTQSPGIDDDFHSYLINLGRLYDFTDDGEFVIEVLPMMSLFSYYLSNRGFDATICGSNLWDDKVDFCKEAISNGYPVVILFIGFDILDNNEFIDHDVVGYKYNNYGIYANFGWKENYTCRCINTTVAALIMLYAEYIDFDDQNHYHSNNYTWTYNSCTGYVCTCGNKVCYHESQTYLQFSNVAHKITCNACGRITYEEHNFVDVGSNSVCTYCGYTVASHVHNYSYSWVSLTQHRATCSCGDSHLEPHVVSNNSLAKADPNTRCMLCGGMVSIGQIIHSNGTKKLIESTANGSYILPNGVIVLDEDDIDSYFNGTLVFNLNTFNSALLN